MGAALERSSSIAPALILPFVSCILPTYNRAARIGLAIRSYQAQTYRRKELIIVDNGTDDTEAQVPEDPTIQYSRITGKLTTGMMRNLCNERARGEVICHFDSDDWSAPERVADQVARLGTENSLTGYYSMLFYDVKTGHAYHWQWGTTQFSLGTSLCYRKALWRHQPFHPVAVGEDYKFVKEALRTCAPLMVTAPAGSLMVAVVHDQQTSVKNLQSQHYHKVDPREIPPAFLTSLRLP